MIIGMMRVKNEARWIERSIASILPLCDRVLVMDDHSTDGTARLASGVSAAKMQVFDSPFTGLDETRDKNHLLAIAISMGAKWIVSIDGDEMVAPASVPIFKQALECGSRCISMRLPYLWDADDQIRVDGVYGEFRRHSAFRPTKARYTGADCGFHCGNVPIGNRAGALTLDTIELLHFGYLLPEDRARKYAWYNAVDPGNTREDRYRHMAAGLDVAHADLIAAQWRMRMEAGLPQLLGTQLLPPPPAADERTAHAGPVELRKL